MYDKYYLSQKQIEKINNWHKSINEPLFIYGPAGIGKTSLAKELLQGTVLTIIDSLMIKNNMDVETFILDIVQKNNITLMFQQNIQKRGILIDDINEFNKYDKKKFNSIINFLNSDTYYNAKIIVTCDNKIINNRKLNPFQSRIILNYNLHIFHKITNTILKEKNIYLSVVELNQLINKSKFNLNTFNSLIENKNNDSIDNFDTNEKLYEGIFLYKHSLKEIIRIYINEKTTISFNLLENISSFFDDIHILAWIYQNYEIADIIDTKYINIECISEYYIILTIYSFYLQFKYMKNNKIYKMINNKYISHSLIYIYQRKLDLSYRMNSELMYLYLYLFKNNKHNKIIVKKILGINDKELNFYIKSFNYFYNSNLKTSLIKKI